MQVYELIYQKTKTTCRASNIGEASRIGMYAVNKPKTGGFVMARLLEKTEKASSSSGFT